MKRPLTLKYFIYECYPDCDRSYGDNRMVRISHSLICFDIFVVYDRAEVGQVVIEKLPGHRS